LGRMVEHAAPGGDCQPHRSAQNGFDHADGDAAHDLRRMVLRHCGGDDPRARDHPRTRTADELGRRARRRRAMSLADFFAMGGYGFYVWGSYVMTVVLVAIEIVAVRTRFGAARDAARATGETR